jgi:hypothetical protein
MKVESSDTIPESCAIEARRNGVLLVRVPSRREPGILPDAVFTFRVGDPQYEFWASQFERQQREMQQS